MHITFKTLKSRAFNGFCLLLFIVLAGIQACSTTGKVKEPQTDSEIDRESVLDTMDYERSDNTNGDEVTVSDKLNVESLIDSMSLREKIGQLFFIRVYGYFKSDDSNTYRELVSQVRDYHIGGVTFFNGNIYGQAVLTNKLQKRSEIPLWITQDMEYGAAMRISGTTRFVPAMGVAATRNPDYAYWIGKVTAREAKALGVNQIFAPVLDVNNNPANPVINVRSFAGDPQIVSEFGLEFIRGVQSEGIVSTAKHFPGHGDTDTDTHLSLPMIEYSYSRLDSLELVPFRSAIDMGVQSVMSAHIEFPEISENPGLPGTLDESILNRMLIDSLGFEGMVITDGLDMKGISSNFSPGRAVVRALQAGADLMLLSPDIGTAVNEVERAVKNGIITEERIEKSVRKLLHWKKKHGLFSNRTVDIEKLTTKIRTRKNELIADEISRNSLTLLKNNNDILPIRAEEYPRVMVLSVADDETGNTGSYFARLVRSYHPNVTFHVLDGRSGAEEKREILEDARKTDLLIIGSFIYVRTGREVQISSEQMDLLEQLPRKPSALVAFGNPYVVHDLPDTDVQLMAWAANRAQARSVAPALFGGSKISGRLPIEIPGMYEIGHGLDLPQTAIRYDEAETAGLSTDSLNKVDRIMNQAVYDSTFPGGVVTVLKDGVIAYQKPFGYYTYDKLEKVEPSDIYDLASLTKVVATTTSIMKLVDEGRLDLDDRVGQYIPEYRQGAKQRVTIRHLLLHNSGLPPFRVYIDKLKTEKEIIEAVKNEPLTHKPGEKFVYSDLGFILLGEIIEQLTGMTLDRYVRKTFLYPLGMSSTFFNPRKVGRWISNRVPPTEIDTVYRNQLIHAEVNDERAWYLNGVAGHAGLFSSGYDLAVYAQMLLQGGTYAGRRYLQNATVQSFTGRQSSQSDRGYGFDHKSKGFSTAGTLAGDATFGHTGFTGTSMWIDPEKDLAIIILTNRTYPHRSYGKNINSIRAKVADAVISSIIH